MHWLWLLLPLLHVDPVLRRFALRQLGRRVCFLRDRKEDSLSEARSVTVSKLLHYSRRVYMHARILTDFVVLVPSLMEL